MLELDRITSVLRGPKGSIQLSCDDEVTRKLLMLIEGQCMGLGATRAAKKYGYCKQRYFQLLNAFKEGGAAALKSKKPGPKTHYRRTDELVRQTIRHRFLDPDSSPQVIAQKLRQCGFTISIRSVRRVLDHYGLQKKNLRLSARCQRG